MMASDEHEQPTVVFVFSALSFDQATRLDVSSRKLAKNRPTCSSLPPPEQKRKQQIGWQKQERKVGRAFLWVETDPQELSERTNLGSLRVDARGKLALLSMSHMKFYERKVWMHKLMHALTNENKTLPSWILLHFGCHLLMLDMWDVATRDGKCRLASCKAITAEHSVCSVAVSHVPKE